MKRFNIIKVTKVILDLMFVLGIVGLISLPFTLNFLGNYYSKKILEYYPFMMFILGISAIFGIFIIYELRSMMKTVIAEDCFIYRNVQSLKRMGGISIMISFLYIIKLWILPTPATLIIIIVFFVAALFSVVLSQVFEKAVQYKEENDLTI